MKRAYATLLRWAKRNERHLSSIFFLGGFVGDVIAFSLLEVNVVSAIFAAYILVGATAALVSHFLMSRPELVQGMVSRSAAVFSPLLVQYAIGGALSGSLVFYTKSSVLSVSWPFLLLLAVVFFGNELFRNYRNHLAFQTTLFFFALYAYLIFQVPIVLNTLGWWVFLLSSVLAAGIFSVFLLVLYRVGVRRFRESFKQIIVSTVAILLALNGAYFTGLIPPIPLSLKEARVYHGVTRTAEGYAVITEPTAPWWEEMRGQTVHHVPGTPLYVFSSVFAPVQFSTNVVHEWEHFDKKQGWVLVGKASYPVVGGRAGGYRGYTYRSDLTEGRWRVTIKNAEGQAIGRVRFLVKQVSTAPLTTTEYR